MNRQRLLRRAAVTVLLIALAVIFLMEKGDAPVAPRPAVEPDLFAFIKPMPSTPSTTPEEIPAGENLDASPMRTPPSHEVEREGARHVASSPADIVATEREAQRMRGQGASDDAIYRMRAHALSAEAAARLADMEHAEGGWRQRIQTYQLEKEKLLAAQGLRESSQAMESLQRLRDAYFNAEEQERLAAYEAPLVPQLTLH